MTRTGLTIALTLAAASLFAGGAMAQASGDAMSSDAMSASGDHMSPAKTTDAMSSGAMASDHMSSGAMASDHMAAHKHAKMAKKAKTDHMTAGATTGSH